jgi:hypothetical protein
MFFPSKKVAAQHDAREAARQCRKSQPVRKATALGSAPAVLASLAIASRDLMY